MPVNDLGAELRVDGLKELRKTFGQLGGKELKSELREAHKRIASEIADRAKAKAPVLTGKLRDSIKGLASQTDARIKAGKKTVAYYGWIDFGGKITFKTRQTERVRPFLKEGRIIYPTIKQNWNYIRTQFETELNALLDREGLL